MSSDSTSGTRESNSNGGSTSPSEKPAEEEDGFREKLEEIDEILETLQAGELELEESLDLYETSIGLLRDCKEILNRSEDRIEMLKEEGEEILTEPFDPETEPDEGS